MSRAVQIAAAGICVTFTPSGDRFTQQIELGGEPLLRSVDEAAESTDAWPPSPPLQDVHLEERPGGRQLALMIGRAGTSHWSISCELDPVAGELQFDVACRIKEASSWLGSTYQMATGITYQGDANSGELRHANRTLCRIATDADCEIAWHAVNRWLVFTLPLEASPKADANVFPRTIRWRFKLINDSEVS